MFPSNQEYQIAVQNLDKFIAPFAPAFKNGKPHRMKGQSYKLQVYAGGFSRVFPIDVGIKTYALRCWISDAGDVEHRYKEIDKYLKQQKLPYFVEFHYIKDGILVNGNKYPIIQMEWANGKLLKDFIAQSLNTKEVLLETANMFAKMVKELHTAHISHGDLQHGNILVNQVKKNIGIKLIDYDSLFVPKLAGYPEQIRGLACYQHPSRLDIANSRQTNEKADYFSELIIYLSLYALSEKPSLWKSFNVEDSDGLLFSQNDIENPKDSKVFGELKKLSSEIKELAKILEDFCYQPSTDNFAPLENVLKSIQPQPRPSEVISSVLPSTPSTTPNRISSSKSTASTTGKKPSELLNSLFKKSPNSANQTNAQSPTELLTKAIDAVENPPTGSSPLPSKVLQQAIDTLQSQQTASEKLNQALKTLQQTSDIPSQKVPSDIISKTLQTLLKNLLPKRPLQKKSLKWTLFLSLVIPGMGHIYNGKITTGILTTLITVTSYMSLVILGIIVHLFVIIDAIIKNIKRNKSHLCPCCNKPTLLKNNILIITDLGEGILIFLLFYIINQYFIN
jgi:TM2 domain-containing membrane protein YozV